MRSIHKVLIANRGEIAVRVIQGARRLGLRTVAVYSDADRHARHVLEADEAVHIGPSTVSQSYLVGQKLIQAAQAAGAEAIHPGYGFLAENADFARACAEAGLIFIGPGPEAIELMGNKRASKIKMIAAGVPCVPGYEGEDQADGTLLEELQKIGCPVMIKAAAGGGGRGMRLCHDPEQAAALIKSARSEAQSAFGSGELILEKAVVGARHVEIQVFGDAHGAVVHLGERDCSIQRRHQKVVEESPSPAVDADLRARMGAAAVTAAKSIGYRNAGTVEFLLGADGAFYFLEMNTRLQVEHPVTELVTGVDLVEWQFRIADGEPLPLAQEQICQQGHAIEVRLCAEDSRAGDLPQTGAVLRWRAPQGEGVRMDHCVVEGGEISPYYDSMIGKLIAHGHDRESARMRLRRALADLTLHGVISNADFLQQIISEPVFASGDFDTGYIPAHFPDEERAAAAPDPAHWAVTAMVLYWDDAWRLYSQADYGPEMAAWFNSNRVDSHLKLAWDGQERLLHISSDEARRCTVRLEGKDYHFTVDRCDGFERQFYFEDVRRSARYTRHDGAIWISFGGRTWCYQDLTLAPPQAPEAGSDGRICAGSDGKVMDVLVRPGEQVSAGQTVAVLEAMKMEFQLATPVPGVVKAVHAEAGEQVANRQLIVELEVSAED